MSEQIENIPNKETEMATSQEEASEDQPENPPQQHTEEQPKNPEQQPSAEGAEEEEENKKTVTEENRPHKSAKEDDDSNSLRDEKQLNESVDRAKDDKNPRNGDDKDPRNGDDKNPRNGDAKNPRNGDDKNPRNVPLESDQLEPFLVRLEHDPKTQLNFWTSLENYHRENGLHPFDRRSSMEDFLNNWLLARVPWLDFQQTFERLRQRYIKTEAAIGGNLNSLNPPDREVFLLTNKILTAYLTERKQKKRKIQETSSSSFSKKPVLIGGSKVPPEEPVHRIKQQKTNMVLDTNLKQQKMHEYTEEEKVKPRENPEEKRRENPVEEQKETSVKKPNEHSDSNEEEPASKDRSSTNSEKGTSSSTDSSSTDSSSTDSINSVTLDEITFVKYVVTFDLNQIPGQFNLEDVVNRIFDELESKHEKIRDKSFDSRSGQECKFYVFSQRIWGHGRAGKDSKKMEEEDEKEMRPEMQPVRGADNENRGSEQTADEFGSSGEEKLMKK